jgi:hypothetical protein
MRRCAARQARLEETRPPRLDELDYFLGVHDP